MKSDSPALRLFLGLVFFLGIAFHVAGLNHPFLGNFAQHQTDYATVVQRWQETLINPSLPVMRFMARGQNRIFLGDFPLNITLVAALVKAAPISIEVAGRGLSALFFFLSLYPLYRVVLLLFKDTQTAWLTLFLYAF
jgi:hypothetical protein